MVIKEKKVNYRIRNNNINNNKHHNKKKIRIKINKIRQLRINNNFRQIKKIKI